MKKLIFLTAIMLLVTFSGISQNYHKVSKSAGGIWNEATKDYDWGPLNDVNMTVITKGNIILVDDGANSVYMTFDVLPLKPKKDVRKQTAWKAIDEKDRKCIVKLVQYIDYQILYIIYPGIVIEYLFD